MREIWLHSNTRLLRFALAIVALAWFVGLGFYVNGRSTTIAVVVCGPLTLVLVGLIVALRRPRIAYEPGQLLLFLRSGSPIRVPIELAEGFLLGQGPSHLPGKRISQLETSTLVLKLADRAEEWGRVEVNHSLASWCNHYVTIRGAWSEPLNLALVNRLNTRLAEVSRKPREPQVAR